MIVREDLLARSAKSLHTMLSYAVHAENGSMYNTPPCFGIYLMGLVMKWALAQGGLAAIGAVNERKAATLYAEIDRTGFYRGTAAKDSRSLMNVTFRLPSEELEKAFVKEATAAGLDGLKGHRSVGGIRASIYNAFPEAGVTALVEFMREFERTRLRLAASSHARCKETHFSSEDILAGIPVLTRLGPAARPSRQPLRQSAGGPPKRRPPRRRPPRRRRRCGPVSSTREPLPVRPATSWPR